MFHLEVGNPTSLKFLEELVGLERATFKKNDSWADGELEQMSKKRNSIIVAARLVPDGKLCGYVLCTSTGLNVHVSKIAVRAEYRRQGIAKRLMQAVLRTAATQRRSCSSTLHVALDNEPAVQLYRRTTISRGAMLTR
ncbi:hypothetical protein Vretimale_5988 [Volvox reticuliferus]|uniref:N-acetyltransferase domain-containing protein n=1 Tax=Volvox reticuliferus TaxID=1737510 RepID=A0A8J4G6N0_9CHLO|nr:hypothetical protein Vretifemale_6150 [Volvox reticuliferus]GIM01164.1 hypothetical protein Vretimale_5988 [Volvox reticuliferus]